MIGIEVADRDLPITSPARAAVRLLRPEIAQIKRILTDLLQAARPHIPEMIPADLNTTVEQAVLLVRQQILTNPITIALQKHLLFERWFRSERWFKALRASLRFGVQGSD